MDFRSRGIILTTHFYLNVCRNLIFGHMEILKRPVDCLYWCTHFVLNTCAHGSPDLIGAKMSWMPEPPNVPKLILLLRDSFLHVCYTYTLPNLKSFIGDLFFLEWNVNIVEWDSNHCTKYARLKSPISGSLLTPNFWLALIQFFLESLSLVVFCISWSSSLVTIP